MKDFPQSGARRRRPMSTTTILFALVILQGSSCEVQPGYPNQAACQAAFRGPYVGCYPYDPSGQKWGAFFHLRGSIKFVQRLPNSNECELYLSAFQPEIP